MAGEHVSRRGFLQAGAVAAATVAAVPATSALAEKEEKTSLVPTRPLGKTGEKISMLGLGASRNMETRFFNSAKQEGIRYIDTADCYFDGAHEKAIGDWLKNENRKDWFVVSKDHPKSPDQWVEMLDRRLANLGSDYLDAYFIHCYGDEEYYDHGFKSWPTSKEWAKAADKMKKAGKIRFAGYACHCQPVKLRSELLTLTAKSGWVDMIMIGNNPSLVKKNAVFNKALDACYEAGIGLVSMKECKNARDPEIIRKLVPEFEALGLTTYATILTAVWTDQRFASVCSAMDNLKKLRENVATARSFKPFTKEQLASAIKVIDHQPQTYCAACSGNCRKAGKTTADLNAIARYLTYYEEMGDHKTARELFAALPPESRDLSNIDVHAASCACSSHLDFARVVNSAKEKLA